MPDSKDEKLKKEIEDQLLKELEEDMLEDEFDTDSKKEAGVVKSSYREYYNTQKGKGKFVYSMKNGARYGNLCVDGDVIITILRGKFKRKIDFLDVLHKLIVAVKEDRKNE